MARENLSATHTITVFTFKLDYLEAVNCRVLIHSKLGSIYRVELWPTLKGCKRELSSVVLFSFWFWVLSRSGASSFKPLSELSSSRLSSRTLSARSEGGERRRDVGVF